MMHPSRQAYVEEADDTDMGISLADLRKSSLVMNGLQCKY
jgi:hypothetical protein